MFYDCEIKVLGSKPKIWRKFTVDTNLTIVDLTKYIRETMRLRYHNPYTYCVFRDDGTANNEQDKFHDYDGPIRVMPCVSWIKSSYALAEYFIVPNKKLKGDYYKTTKSENEVTIKDAFEHSDRLVFEYHAGGPYNYGKHGWSIEIEILSRKPNRTDHICGKNKIMEYDSAGYGIVERCGDIDTQNDEQERWGEYYDQVDAE